MLPEEYAYCSNQHLALPGEYRYSPADSAVTANVSMSVPLKVWLRELQINNLRCIVTLDK